MSPGLQVSIPATSIAHTADNKPYTVYHVVLQLPLRKHEVKKRYTDFVNLNHDLVAQTNGQSPAPLPAKSWFRRTVNNETLTEERRDGLEKYVKSIVGSDDARWRSSSAWRSFMNLPSGVTSSTTVNATGLHQHHRSSGNDATDPNQWLDIHNSLRSQIHDARQLLKQREAATTAQSQHSLAAEAKASLIRAATSIAQLEDGLRAISRASKGEDAGWSGVKRLGDGEIRRRKDLIGAAKKEVEGLEGVSKSMATRTATSSSNINRHAEASDGDRAALWNGRPAAATKTSGRVLGGPPKETERTRELDNSGVLQLQKQIMQEQDEDVLSLGKTVAKLKDMGIMINEELELQNEMLGLVEQDSDRLQGKLDVARRRIKKIG